MGFEPPGFLKVGKRMPTNVVSKGRRNREERNQRRRHQVTSRGAVIEDERAHADSDLPVDSYAEDILQHCIESLTDVLSVTSPANMARVQRISRVTAALGKRCGVNRPHHLARWRSRRSSGR